MNFGFVGLGNMASAVIRGMVRSGDFASDRILGFNRSAEKAEVLKNECGIVPYEKLSAMLKDSDVIVLCVKPQVLPDVLPSVAAFCKGKTVITIAAGKPLSWYMETLPEDTALIRAMPNINARVGASSTALCANAATNPLQLSLADKIFSSVGTVHHLSESMFPAFSAICGASGAFLLLYLDAMAQAGVREGFPLPLAQELALESVSGCAKLVGESGEHPVILMNQICSPGGTTIEGVLKLKELGFEYAVTEGIRAIVEKDRHM